MSIHFAGPAVSARALVLASFAGAAAHEIAGNRFFSATLAIDDPGVNDELAVPTISMTKSGDEPRSRSSISPANTRSASPKPSQGLLKKVHDHILSRPQ